jgi:hypothetical protein
MGVFLAAKTHRVSIIDRKRRSNVLQKNCRVVYFYENIFDPRKFTKNFINSLAYTPHTFKTRFLLKIKDVKDKRDFGEMMNKGHYRKKKFKYEEYIQFFSLVTAPVKNDSRSFLHQNLYRSNQH